MERAVLIEGVLLIALSLAGILEACRLIIKRDPQTVLDVLGPGAFVLIVSIALMITGAAHLIAHHRKKAPVESIRVDSEMRKRMISMIFVFTGYLFLIDMVGYFVSTIFFFLLEFRVVGVKSWLTNGILSAVLTTVYFVVFVQYCGLVFPRGILFG